MNLYSLMQDEVEAWEGYYKFLEEHKGKLSPYQIKIIKKIIIEEKRHWRILNSMKQEGECC